MKKRNYWVVYLIILANSIFAQESFVRIDSIEGTDFVLTSANSRTVLRPEHLKEREFNLNAGDMIQTGSGSLVEFLVVSRARSLPEASTRIKIAENTSLVFNGFEGTAADNAASFMLIYGKSRITSAAERSSKLVIHGGTAELQFEAGDISMDYIIAPSLFSMPGRMQQKPLVKFECFRGSALVVLLDSAQNGGGGLTHQVPLTENETLTLDVSPSISFIERKPLNNSDLNYWSGHGFPQPNALAQTQEPVIDPTRDLRNSSADTLTALVPDTPYVPPDYNAYRKANRTKNIILTIGTVLTLAGGAMEVYTAQAINDGKDNMKLFIPLSAIPLGIGILTTIVGILYNPVPSP
ncbi:FecR family protein [Breznakiellaceae bacterium SP9]